MPQSSWRRVRARVHVSLTPVELINPVRSASKKAFSSLLMRYNPELGGAVVAHIGQLEFCGPPAFIDASPFAHVAAVATLLVFAPTKGTELLGVVTHVGPDHLGLSVLSAFHAVLPMDGLSGIYRFESKYTSYAHTPEWKRIDGTDHIAKDRQIRFAVSDLKPTRTGLFQIIASLDHSLRQRENDSHPLGLIPPEQEISMTKQALQQEQSNVESQPADVLSVTRRTSGSHISESLMGVELLTAGNDMLGDALMPVTPPLSAMRSKKRRRVATEPRSVRFEGLETDASSGHQQNDRPSLTADSPLRKAMESLAASVEGSGTTENGVKASGSAEKSHRKEHRKDKKKKKKKRFTQDNVQLSESTEPASVNRKLGQRSAQASNTCVDLRDQRSELKSDLPKESRDQEERPEEGKVRKKEGKISKKKKRARERANEVDRGSKKRKIVKSENEVGKEIRGTNQVIKTEVTENVTEKANAIKEHEMHRDAVTAIELGPMENAGRLDNGVKAEVRLEDDKSCVRQQAQMVDKDTSTERGDMNSEERREKDKQKRKKKKKRRRNSEGEADGDETARKKKKKKKKGRRASEAAIEIERSRSMHH